MTHPEITFVYRNLHKKCWSLKSAKSGRVYGHVKNAVMKNANFVVFQSGRNNVLNYKVKNVHAFVKGEIVSPLSENMEAMMSLLCYKRIRYNPYIHPFFFDEEEKKVESADYVLFTKEGHVYFNPHVEQDENEQPIMI